MKRQTDWIQTEELARPATVARRKVKPRRRVTDEQIVVLKAWIPFNQLARALGISPSYATALRNDHFQHKTPSP
jgi:predicted transcriptional regulator